MGESFRCASLDSLDMSWLPLPRFESRAVCVAVSCRVRGPRAPHPISVGSRRRGVLVRPWMGASFKHAGVDSLDRPWFHCRGLSREQWVLQCMGEGEANGGDDDMDGCGASQWGSDRTGGSAA
jgi:hypothetical protein